MTSTFRQALGLAIAGALAVLPARAAHGQGHEAHHTASRDSGAALPTQPGQDAFAAIAEVVRMLETDPRTDWSRVNIEALRNHLRDMDQVVMLSEVSQSSVPGGLSMVIVGYGRTVGAIKRMVTAHARELARVPGWRVTTEPLARGARLTVTAEPPNAPAEERIRALGFAGLLTVGAHHEQHHLEIARGQAAHGGGPH